jgi:hypothetical protein
MPGVLAQIRTKHVPNTSLKRYPYVSLLGDIIRNVLMICDGYLILSLLIGNRNPRV